MRIMVLRSKVNKDFVVFAVSLAADWQGDDCWSGGLAAGGQDAPGQPGRLGPA